MYTTTKNSHHVHTYTCCVHPHTHHAYHTLILCTPMLCTPMYTHPCTHTHTHTMHACPHPPTLLCKHTHIGGMRPKQSCPCFPSSITLRAAIDGFLIPATAPTAPKVPDWPSITPASHSTCPARLRQDPMPAFVSGESCRCRRRS